MADKKIIHAPWHQENHFWLINFLLTNWLLKYLSMQILTSVRQAKNFQG